MTDWNDMERSGGQRLHLVGGSPWQPALQKWRRHETGLWQTPPSWRTGDLLLTVLDTQPRLLLCLERAARSSTRGSEIEVEPGPIDFAGCPGGLIPVPSIGDRVGRRIPPAPSTLGDVLADAMLLAIQQEMVHPTPWKAREGRGSPSFKRERSTGLKASLLAANGPKCVACERDYGEMLEGRGEAALEMHHLTQLAATPGEVDTDTDEVVLLCGGCHNIVHLAGVGIEELRYQRRPGCPRCGVHHAQRIVLGGPTPSATIGSDWNGGCISTGSSWRCGNCAHQWT